MPIRKRRPIKHLNKNQERLARREGQEQQLHNAGTLGMRFPGLTHLEIQMEFMSPEGHVLNSELRMFEENTRVNFFVDCPGRCGNGRTDMEAVVSQMHNARQTARTAQGRCAQLLFPGSSETCKCELKCKLSASFKPLPEPE